MDDNPRLEYRHTEGVLVVRPLLRVLGPWDGADGLQDEVVEFRDQLVQLIIADGGPVLLDLSGYDHVRNWTWLLPLARGSSGRGQRLAVWVQPAVAEVFAVLRFDRLISLRTTFAEAMAVVGLGNPAEPDAPTSRRGT